MKKFLFSFLFIVFFVGCNSNSEDKARSTEILLSSLALKVLAPNGTLDKDSYTKYWKYLDTYASENNLPDYFAVVNDEKSFYTTNLRIILEFLRSIELSYKQGKPSKTQAFIEYEQDLNNIRELDPFLFVGDRTAFYNIADMRQVYSELIERFEPKAYVTRYSWFTRIKGKNVFYLSPFMQLYNLQEIQEHIKLIEKSLKRAEILFTENYNGDFNLVNKNLSTNGQ